MKTPYLQCRGEAWDKARMRVLVRDDFTCQFHKLGLPATEGCSHEHPETKLRFLNVHHRQERQHGGTHNLDNLITVCRTHHVFIHPHMGFELFIRDKELEGTPIREL